jgi:hypothetical protein
MKPNVEVPLLEAPFAVCHEECPRYDLGRFRSVVTLKMTAIHSSETSVITIATRFKVPKDICNSFRCENFPDDRVLRPYKGKGLFRGYVE